MVRSAQECGRGPSHAAGLRSAILLACATSLAPELRAQALRIGGFDFNATARLQGVYSSNVERARPGSTTASLEDYYVVAGLDLDGERPMGAATTLEISTGMAIEKHFKREDLDNSQNPFGHFGLRSSTEFGRLKVGAHVEYERTSQSQSDAFSPQGLGKARDPRDEFGYGVDADYKLNRFSLAASYDHSTQSHDLDRFKGQDQEVDGYALTTEYKVSERFTPAYKYDHTVTTYPSNPDNDRTQNNHRFMFPFLLWENPNLLYTFTWQQEDRGDGEEVKWKPRNTVSLTDAVDLSPRMTLDYFAVYDNYPQPAQDVIQFTYGAALSHQIARTLSHRASVRRQPVATLGSTLASDQTQYAYDLEKRDLFIYNLDLGAGVTLDRTIPEGDAAQPTQETLTYTASLTHHVSLTRRLSRIVSYDYSHEDLNTQPEVLEEHRLTLSYEYKF